MDEQEAIRLCQGGEKEHFRVLVEAHKDKAFRTACLILIGDVSTAEDVTQEAFLLAWQSLHTFELGRPFGPWLRTIVVRCALKRLPMGPFHGIVSVEEVRNLEVPDTAPSPYHNLRAVERSEAVEKALKRLSLRQQTILRLRFYNDLAIGEIAELMSIPEGTVKSDIHRGKQELGKMLRGVLGDEVA